MNPNYEEARSRTALLDGKTPAGILREARHLISDPKKWGTGSLSDNSGCMCALGAVAQGAVGMAALGYQFESHYKWKYAIEFLWRTIPVNDLVQMRTMFGVNPDMQRAVYSYNDGGHCVNDVTHPSLTKKEQRELRLARHPLILEWFDAAIKLAVAETPAADVLEAAVNLIRDEHTLRTGTLLDAKGCMCSLGAIAMADGEFAGKTMSEVSNYDMVKVNPKAVHVLALTMSELGDTRIYNGNYSDAVWRFNDGRSPATRHAEVTHAFRRAIAKSKGNK